MTKRLHACIRCSSKMHDKPGKFSRPRGLTRHADGLCSQCRRQGAKVVGGALVVNPPLDTPSYAGRGA